MDGRVGAEGFSREAYVPGVVAEFLKKSVDADVFVEFIQNELDAGSTQTTFRFSPTAFQCEGNGEPVGELGWRRLRTVVGAGGRNVPRKVGGIGAKNHGLRTGFRIADDIIVESAGIRARLTLWGPEATDTEIDPGCWPLETAAESPPVGTRIRLPLRNKPLRLETLMLGAPDPAAVEQHFRQALAMAPARFIGAMCPGIRDSWTLTLCWSEEEVRLDFRAGPLRNGMFERTCVVSSSGEVVFRERVRPFRVAQRDDWDGRTPDFFVRDGWVVGEISWPVDKRGRSIAGAGILRYPIAYPAIDASRSRFGFSLSAPFESEDTRYAPARGHPDNELLLRKADEAVLEQVLPALVDREGASALRLLRDKATNELERETELCARALREGSVAVEGARGDLRLGRLKKRGDVAVAASGPAGRETIDPRLFPFAPKTAARLSARTPPFLVQALARAASVEGRYRLRWVRPADIVSQVIESSSGGRPVSRFKEVLVLLGRLAADGTLAPPLQKRLFEEGRLPTRAGQWIAWSEGRRLKDEVPDVPGAPPPPVIRAELNPCLLLRSGSTRLKRFDLDEHLSGADFTTASEEQRDRFYSWLKRNWDDLDARTWAELARQPVWPIEGGGHRPLAGICVLRTLRTHRLLAGNVSTPSESLRAFQGFKTGSRASLRLSRRPSEGELSAWYADRRKRVEEAPDDARISETLKLDDDLSALLSDKDLGPSALRALGPHVTASRAGDLIAVADLHLETEPVKRCSLLESDLLPPGRTRLYQLFEGRQAPSHDAILRALKGDPQPGRLLYDRLAAYRKSASLDTLSSEAVIPTAGGVVPPLALKLRSGRVVERDLWGNWRKEFLPEEPTPRRTDLLLKAGVAPPELTARLSREFFSWLGSQSASVQYENLRQVLRHWIDAGRGPLSWWRRPDCASIRCLPVEYGPIGARLVSRGELSRAKNTILLPDEPALWHLVRERDAKLGFIIVQIEGVAGSILQGLRQDPDIRGLRDAAGPPVAVEAIGSPRADTELLSFVRRLYKGRISEALPKNLQQYEVPAEDLRQNWRHLLSGVAEVCIVRSLKVRYRLRRSPYDVPVRGAADLRQGKLFIAEGVDPIRGLYEAVAQLILHRTTSLSGAAVQQAAESGNYDFKFSGTRGPAEQDGDDPQEPSSPGAADLRPGHNPRDAIDRLPDPSPFSKSGIDPKGPKRPFRPRPSRSPLPKSPSARDTLQEADEKAALRERHYAHHCQACLGTYQPAQAAPPGSYVAEAAYRATLLEAHHVDHLQTNVILGARNLLLLCEHHHRKLGDLLTGAKVLAALSSAVSATRRFEAEGSGLTLKGVVAKIDIDSTEGVARLFFTKEHAEAWLRRQGPP